MLELRGVAKRFDGAAAVYPLSLRFPRGGTTVLIGPSGCGKSTLLRMLIGLAPPDEGDVLFDGGPLGGQLREARLRTGYVIQDGGLFPHLTARENICLMPTQLGWSEDRQAEQVAALAALTRFPSDRLDAYPGELSGGQRQRVALMRALALDPDVLCCSTNR
jgi:osmoprotectant transport system ATP-binding protein